MMVMTEEEKKAVALEAVAYKNEGKGPYLQFARERGIAKTTLSQWISKYCNEGKKSTGFVKLNRVNPPKTKTDRQIHITYFGAELDVSEDSLETVLKAVRASYRI